jgi:hypothetical protein
MLALVQYQGSRPTAPPEPVSSINQSLSEPSACPSFSLFFPFFFLFFFHFYAMYNIVSSELPQQNKGNAITHVLVLDKKYLF